MAVLVCFHAHPDDEAIATGGTMAQAKAAGHRVVLVVATRGEHGEVVPGVLRDGEQLGLRRVHESFASAELLGADRVELLGYVDSGMMGEPTNDEPYAFWQADVDLAARRLAAILEEESAHGPVVLTVYDEHGGYGHPDHIQVHRVGLRAAELAPVERVFQATMNRDRIRAMMAEVEARAAAQAAVAAETGHGDVADPGRSAGGGADIGTDDPLGRGADIGADDPLGGGADIGADDPLGGGADIDAELGAGEDFPDEMRERLRDEESPERFGEPESAITHGIDVTAHLDVKLACMRAHASQISDDSFFLTMGPAQFARAFGMEWFVEWGVERPPGAPFGDDLLIGLA